MANTHKLCTKCGIQKPRDDFHNNKRTKSGKAQHCKACCKDAKAAYLDKTRKPPQPQWRIWTTEKILAAAQQFATRSEFRNGNQGAHSAAQRHDGGLDLFCAHMRPVKQQWSFDELLLIARKYKTIGEFRRNENGAYNAGLRSGRKDELYAHMVRQRVETQRFVYVIKSLDGQTAYVGLSQNPQRRYGQHRRNGLAAIKRLITAQHTFTVISGAVSEQSAKDLEAATIRSLRDAGINVLNSAAAGNVGALGTLRWTRDEIAAEALKYQSVSDFRDKSSGAYSAAVRRFGGVREFCGHMPFPRLWDSESIAVEARKFQSRTSFEKASGGAVNAARRLGIMDDVCAHMPWLARRPQQPKAEETEPS